MNEDDPFIQSDGETLKNRLGIENDPEELSLREREYTSERAETVHDEVSGNFDADHLRAIHQHIFQDVYEWAGTMRSETITLEGEQINVPAAVPTLEKGSTEFLPSAYVERGSAHVAELANSEGARSADPAEFADAAAEVFSTLNHVHPFREGNGRTQRVFMEQLAERAGHTLDFEGVTGERMTEASIEASNGDTGPLRDIIAESIDPERVALRMEAFAALERSGVEADGFWIETASPGDRIEAVFLDRHETHLTVVTDQNHFIAMPPDALPDHVGRGDPVDMTFTPPAREIEHIARPDLEGLHGAIQNAWADIQDMQPGAERDQLAADYIERLNELPPDLREEVMQRLEPEQRSASAAEDHDLDL